MMQFVDRTEDVYGMITLSAEQRNRLDEMTLVSPLFQDNPSLLETVVKHVCVTRASKAPPADGSMEVYRVRFVEYDRYWVTKTRQNRMVKESRVLYRPTIVNSLVNRVESLLDSGNETGIMVKGPQGVGKSLSIVNLVRKLLSSDQYVVTFIPNCEIWKSLVTFYQFILFSVGVDDTTLMIIYGLN
jgi:hypothetical protein